MRRWRERLNEHGYSGLWDYRKRGPSPKRVPMATVEQVLRLYREQYFDFNVRHFHEKLREVHGIGLSYGWVKTALQTAGFVKKRRNPGSHRKRRPRRPLPGMMLHIDGSEHRWFADARYYELIVILDDATSEIYYAQLVEAACTQTVMAALREVIETKGLFCSLYSDRAGHFFVTPKRGERVDASRPTQVGRAASQGAIGAELWHLARPVAAGIEIAGHYRSGKGERVSAHRLHCGVQQQIRRAGRPERQRLRATPAQGLGLDFQRATRADGKQ
jgi:hypothetical protein